MKVTKLHSHCTSIIVVICLINWIPKEIKADSNCTKSYAVESFRTKLNNCIFKNYNLNIRPTRDLLPINITVDFVVLGLRFNQAMRKFILYGLIMAEWQDEYINWNPSDYGGISTAMAESKQIWTPKFYYISAHRGPYSSYKNIFQNTDTDIKSDGSVKYLNYISIWNQCDTNFKDYPRDSHYCYIIIMVQDGINLTLISTDALNPNSIIMQIFKDMAWDGMPHGGKEFLIENATVEIVKAECFECTNNVTQDMYIHLHFRRDSSLLSLPHLKALAIGILLLVPLVVSITNIARLAVPIITFFTSLIEMRRISTILKVESAHDVPTLFLFYRNIVLLSLFIVCETFVYMLLTERSISLPDRLDRLYCYIVQYDFYSYSQAIKNLCNRENRENDNLVEQDSDVLKNHTYEDFMQLIDMTSLYLLIFLMLICYLPIFLL